MLFCDISIADTATPPAFAAFAGPNRCYFRGKYCHRFQLQGIFAPSPIAITVHLQSAYGQQFHQFHFVSHKVGRCRMEWTRLPNNPHDILHPDALSYIPKSFYSPLLLTASRYRGRCHFHRRYSRLNHCRRELSLLVAVLFPSRKSKRYRTLKQQLYYLRMKSASHSTFPQQNRQFRILSLLSDLRHPMIRIFSRQNASFIAAFQSIIMAEHIADFPSYRRRYRLLERRYQDRYTCLTR